MPKLTNELKQSLTKALDQTPLWEGPYSEGKNGGVTYSLLSRFLVCRHKFWYRVVKGLKQEEGFDYKMEYGNAWHLCEENLAAGKDWKEPLKQFCLGMSRSYPANSPDVVKMYECCKVQFPIYVEYWSKQKDVKNRKPLGQEEVFKVRYKVPCGRKVVLRGKFDSRDLIDKKVYVQENKSKSDIDPDKLKNDLPTDLQSMLYVITSNLVDARLPIGGVRYNVIRRPLSGMKYNIKQRKGMGKAKKGEETAEEFYTRLGEVIRETSFDAKGKAKEHSDFFVRFKVDLTDKDINNFKRMIFNPVLTQLCDWWDSIQGDPFDPWTTDIASMLPPDFNERIPNKHHYLFPSGCYNPALEGRAAAIDELIQTGNERGFKRTETLFNELE